MAVVGDTTVAIPTRVLVLGMAHHDGRILAESKDESEEEDEPRCPACGSWHVGKRVDGVFATLARWFGAGSKAAADAGQWQCYRCGKTF